ncbi:hypothetical protein B0H13DRAFT_1875277 [Mycena leptocephala]|nr:hypothetical protein B0H13DRAFT_1875277 [Mycena leptocephala]
MEEDLSKEKNLSGNSSFTVGRYTSNSGTPVPGSGGITGLHEAYSRSEQIHKVLCMLGIPQVHADLCDDLLKTSAHRILDITGGSKNWSVARGVSISNLDVHVCRLHANKPENERLLWPKRTCWCGVWIVRKRPKRKGSEI